MRDNVLAFESCGVLKKIRLHDLSNSMERGKNQKPEFQDASRHASAARDSKPLFCGALWVSQHLQHGIFSPITDDSPWLTLSNLHPSHDGAQYSA